MVATAAVYIFFPVAFPSPKPGTKSSGAIGGSIRAHLDAYEIKSKSTSSGNLQAKANGHAPSKVKGTEVGVMEGRKTDDEVISSPPTKTFVSKLPDSSLHLAAIITSFLAAKKQCMMLGWKPKRPNVLADPFEIGMMVQGGLVLHQNFSIKSYEVGPDQRATIETLMNFLQETAINHLNSGGHHDGSFGSTPEMCKRNLTWVSYKMQVLVDRYPSWRDVIEVDTWMAENGKNGIRYDWLVRDSQTGEILTRASCAFMMMNKETRRLAKMPDEVRAELSGYFVDSPPVVDQDTKKLPKLDDNSADYVRSGLMPRWSDLDVNQHMNNVKYIGWILESTPVSMFETHELAALTLEYRRECLKDSVVQSLTSMVGNGVGNLATVGSIEWKHLLRLESGTEILKGKTEWRPIY